MCSACALGGWSEGSRMTFRSMVLSSAMLLLACTIANKDCVPGEAIQCACANGGSGAQTCGTDETFGPCECMSRDPTDRVLDNLPESSGGMSGGGGAGGGGSSGGAWGGTSGAGSGGSGGF